MDTMRRKMIWAGGLFACVLAVAIGARAADSGPVKVESAAVEKEIKRLDDVSAGRLFPLPETYSVKRRYPDGHPGNNLLAGVTPSCASEEHKEIYTSKLGTFGFRPGRGRRIADDLITELVRDCTVCSLTVRVSGGVEDGDGTFRADFSLFDACPDAGEGGQEIPGTLLQFSGLEDDAGQFHDLVLDYTDRGQCQNGTCPGGESCDAGLQDCVGGTCDDGSSCDPSVPTCADESDCSQGICSDGNACDIAAPNCADLSACRRACDDGTLCVQVCGGISACTRDECSGDLCQISQQNCTGGTCADDGSPCDTAGAACDDGSACEIGGFVCVEDPLQIPPTVWVRFRFDTDDAIIVMGSPPTRGFSSDGYDDPQAPCTAWFAGWPVFPHATIFAEIIAPVTCETHFLAYLAANPNKPAFLPSDIGFLPNGNPAFTTPTTRLADDITLTVDSCILSAYELGMKGNVGEFQMEMDLRWPDINTVQTDTIFTFTGRGMGSAEVAHVTIPEDVTLGISFNDQPIAISWKSNKANTGAMEVNITQAGTSGPTMLAFDVDTSQPDRWIIVPDGDFTPAVFYAAIFCRGDAPRGACCPNQAAIPGRDMNCFDGDIGDDGLPEGVPVTSCLGTRWQIDSTCAENTFNPPCGTHACCLPSANCDDFTFDDCTEICTIDTDPILCGPVCNGGPKHRLPCDPVNGDADCTDPDGPDDGICDLDAECPGQRTCGLTGCQLNGEFTGRPCDLNNPDLGDSDCKTCSSSGEYCRARCTSGFRKGRPCEENADCPDSVCDANFDCDGAQTCGSVQTCVNDPGQCSLRCSKWSSGRFCGEDGQRCPHFACFDAVGDCLEAEDEHFCKGRCSVSRPCTSDSNCQAPDGTPIFGFCLPSGLCSGFQCETDNDCSGQSLGTCRQTDVDCPIGTRCLLEFRICTGREGCDNLDCCGAVCSRESECCDNSLGASWDSFCVSLAENNCTISPGNDDCHSNAPNEGAFEVLLADDDTDLPCIAGSSVSCSGGKSASNKFASSDLSDPGFCCNNRGVDVKGAGTIWFKFVAMHDTARVHTCGTEGSATTIDSLVQVFRALDQTPDDGSDRTECESLEVVACNDDGGCGSSGETCPQAGCLASVCAIGLNVGETYYVMMAAKQGLNQGGYNLDIESPCPTGQAPPPGSVCENGRDLIIPDGPIGLPFDLSDANLDCPAEPSLPNMTNDVWFIGQATCAGNLIVQTCGFEFGEENPDTTLAVYRTSLPTFSCPPAELVGFNDDSSINPVCSIGHDGEPGLSCDADADCIFGCSISGNPCVSAADCVGTETCILDLRAQCETVVGGIGDSSLTSCVQGSCASDGECPGGSCVGGVCDPDDSQCHRGVCEDDEVTLCDSTIFGHCLNGAGCDGIVDCADGSDCNSQCGFFAPEQRPAVCLPQETCVVGNCSSECAPASFLEVPTFQGQWYFIRVGGTNGSEPSGTVRLSCERDDCNNGGIGNGIPDGIEIENDPSLDCNLNGELDECDIDQGRSSDCNCNDIPDECEINADIPINCSAAVGPCDEGPFFCFNAFACDLDVNTNGIPDCCDDDELPAVCPACPVVGACCDAGACTVVQSANCTGEYAGDGTACAGGTCTVGSCCEASLACRDDEVASQCVAAGETFRPGDDCTIPCDPVGACCDSGACTLETAASCGGVYQGDGTACAGGTCTVGSCCELSLACRDDEVASQCVAAGETFRPGDDCTIVCPPSCGMDDLTGVYFDDDGVAPADFDKPGNCAIDAREPHSVSDVNARNGWDRMVLEFSCDPTALALVPGDFTVVERPSGVAPGVLSVGVSGGDTVTVILADSMTPQQWTCITHIASGNEWCAGYLPANANQDEISNAGDILDLVNSVNFAAGAVLPLYASDMNRSGGANGQDILRLIDLLNGAGDFDVWLTRSLPDPCPSAP